MTKAKILVLSDVHYPLTDPDEILGIINDERPDKIIVVGDGARDVSYVEKFLAFLQTSSCKNCVLINGDSDASPSGAKSLKLNLNGREFVFIHGHQFNVWSEGITKKVASLLKKLDPDLPVWAFAIWSRIKSRTKSPYIILGHSHALKFFPRLRVASAGCLTTAKNVYNDRGYIVINAEDDGEVELSVNELPGGKQVFDI